MKTKRLILALTTWTVVIVMSLHSCQTDSGYDNVIQENNLTEADLFVASEAYKNLEKEIKKNPQEINQLKEPMCSIGLINKTIPIMVKIVAEIPRDIRFN